MGVTIILDVPRGVRELLQGIYAPILIPTLVLARQHVAMGRTIPQQSQFTQNNVTTIMLFLWTDAVLLARRKRAGSAIASPQSAASVPIILLKAQSYVTMGQTTGWAVPQDV